MFRKSLADWVSVKLIVVEFGVLIPAIELGGEQALPDGRRLADALCSLGLDEGVRWAGPPLRVARAG